MRDSIDVQDFLTWAFPRPYRVEVLGLFAEYIVGSELRTPRNTWDAVDVRWNHDGREVCFEVKATSRERVFGLSHDPRPVSFSTGLTRLLKVWGHKPVRVFPADVVVFALAPTDAEVLRPGSWEMWAVPVAELPEKPSISEVELNSKFLRWKRDGDLGELLRRAAATQLRLERAETETPELVLKRQVRDWYRNAQSPAMRAVAGRRGFTVRAGKVEVRATERVSKEVKRERAEALAAENAAKRSEAARKAVATRRARAEARLLEDDVVAGGAGDGGSA